MQCVAIVLIEGITDGLEYADDVTDVTLDIFESHIHHTAIIGYAIKLGMDFYSPFAKFLTYVPRENHISATVILHFMDNRVKFIYFGHQQQLVRGLLQSHSASIHPTMS